MQSRTYFLNVIVLTRAAIKRAVIKDQQLGGFYTSFK